MFVTTQGNVVLAKETVLHLVLEVNNMAASSLPLHLSGVTVELVVDISSDENDSGYDESVIDDYTQQKNDNDKESPSKWS